MPEATSESNPASDERRLRILHVVPTYVPAWRYGGPIRSVHGLAKAQARTGDAVTVFTTDRDGAGRLAVPNDADVRLDGVAVRYFRAGSPSRLGFSRPLGAALRAGVGSFDVVHLHSVFQYPTLAGARAAARVGVPYVVSPRGMLVPELVESRGALRKRAWIRFFERRTLSEAKALVATSEVEAQDLGRMGLALAPVAVVPNGVDPDDVGEPAAGEEQVATLPSGRPLVVYLGRISWKKGLDRLLDAFSMLGKGRLVIAGTDDEGLSVRLRDRAERLGVLGRVSFPGEVRGEAKRALFARTSVFVLPSVSENFGIAALEAMAAGVPVVLTRGVGLAAEVEGSGCGVVCGDEPGNLAAAVGGLLADPVGAKAMGLRGREVATKRYSWAAVALRMRGVYLGAIASGGTKSGEGPDAGRQGVS